MDTVASVSTAVEHFRRRARETEHDAIFCEKYCSVALPELHRVRKIFRQKKLLVVVQDAFFTETCQLADIVLPAAIWGEKEGTFINSERRFGLAGTTSHCHDLTTQSVAERAKRSRTAGCCGTTIMKDGLARNTPNAPSARQFG